MSGVAILGSSRSDGNTAKVLKRLIEGCECSFFDLNELNIQAFRYDQKYEPDRFLEVVHQMIEGSVTIFATPVYWYSYSAVLKGFIDRMSDLLMSRKDLGRKLRGKTFALVTTSTETEPDRDLVSTFQRLCEYLDVANLGTLHAVEDGEFDNPELVKTIRDLM